MIRQQWIWPVIGSEASLSCLKVILFDLMNSGPVLAILGVQEAFLGNLGSFILFH